MSQYELQFLNDHLFLNLEDSLWLLDTGNPTTFGHPGGLTLAGRSFTPAASYLGLDAAKLSGFVGLDCAGLIGGDILNAFDLLFDLPSGAIEISEAELAHPGAPVPLQDFMGVPIVEVNIGGSPQRMFLDTGAQVSYWQDDALASFPDAGAMEDFFPGLGAFTTDTHTIPFELGGAAFETRCGRLPMLLGMTLMMAGVTGIVGNVVFKDRVVGYFPRRGMLAI